MTDAKKAFNTYAVEFSGGEPTLRPELPELISYAKSMGFATRIVTNGTVLGAFEDVIQTELIRARWEEIKKLQTQPAILHI